MPDYAGLVRGILANVASPQVESFKDDVTWQAFATQDTRGAETFADPVIVRALIDRKSKLIRTASGAFAMTLATLTFVDPLTAVDPRDIFTLIDGATAPVVDTGGFVDPETHQPFVTEVTLGTVVRGQ